MERYITGRTVACEPINTDPYGRIVGLCHINRIDVAGFMVRQGMAWDVPRFSGGWYAGEQEQARRRRIGVWAGPCMSPWEWRQHSMQALENPSGPE